MCNNKAVQRLWQRAAQQLQRVRVKAGGYGAGKTRLQDLKLQPLPLLLRRAVHHGTKQRGHSGRNLMIPVTSVAGSARAASGSANAHAHVVLVRCGAFSERGNGAGIQQLANCAAATIANTLEQGGKGGRAETHTAARTPGPQRPDERQND
jgi:hypothetical protein